MTYLSASPVNPQFIKMEKILSLVQFKLCICQIRHLLVGYVSKGIKNFPELFLPPTPIPFTSVYLGYEILLSYVNCFMNFKMILLYQKANAQEEKYTTAIYFWIREQRQRKLIRKTVTDLLTLSLCPLCLLQHAWENWTCDTLLIAHLPKC